MLANIGSKLLVSSIFLYFINFILAFGYINIKKLKIIHILAGTCTSLTFLILILAFLTSDFTVENVLLNSSTIKPIIYKIAGAWASHEGSILLWTTLLSIVSICSSSIHNFPTSIERYIIAIKSFIILSFVNFVYFTSNPLQANLTYYKQGFGLNPILQDIGLVIHPPILYLGYACYLIPFIYNIVALLNISHNKILIYKSTVFSKIGWLSLTIGITLGSWWAYRELGWGGYWFFDPVENISLMPWISATIYHHSLIAIKSKNSLIKWSILSAIVTFLLCLLGTFFVRAGFLVSVHSFSNTSSRTYFILIFLSTLSLASLGLYALQINKFSVEVKITLKELLVLLGNILWLTGLLVIFISLAYPIIYKAIFGHKIMVGYNYFTSTFIPITLPTSLLAGSIYYLKNPNYYNLRVVTVVIISYIIIYFSYKNLGIGSLAIFCAIYLIQESLWYMIKSSNFFTIMLPPKILSASISHLGFGILILAISLNSKLQQDIEFIGKVGDTVNTHGLSITLQNLKYAKGKNYFRQIAELRVENNNQEILILKPENRFYHIEEMVIPESNIYSTLFYDICAILSKVDRDIIYVTIYHRPFMALLWIGTMIIAIGMLISIFHLKSQNIYSNDFKI